jgi:hypothetical protein
MKRRPVIVTTLAVLSLPSVARAEPWIEDKVFFPDVSQGTGSFMPVVGSGIESPPVPEVVSSQQLDASIQPDSAAPVFVNHQSLADDIEFGVDHTLRVRVHNEARIS